MAKFVDTSATFSGKDLSGQKFGRLTVLRYFGTEVLNGRKIRPHWWCRCDCGSEMAFDGTNIRSGNTSSCGCLHRERAKARATKHGLIGHRLYSTWRGMKDRCYSPNHSHYAQYGGRGIGVDEPWRSDFAAFVRDMEPTWRPGLTVDRIDVNGNYGPGKCRWSTQSEQCSNKRNNVLLTVDGVTKTVTQWAADTGIHVETMRARIARGLSDEAVVRTVPRGKGVTTSSSPEILDVDFS